MPRSSTRSSDVESGKRDILATSKAKNDVLEDYIQELQEGVKPYGLHKQIDDNFLDKFESSYSHLRKDKASKLFEKLLFCKTFGNQPDNLPNVGNYSELITSFDTWMSKPHCDAWLKICAIANEDEKSPTQFGFMVKLYASITGNIKGLTSLPKYGVALIIEKNWHMRGRGDLFTIVDRDPAAKRKNNQEEEDPVPVSEGRGSRCCHLPFSWTSSNESHAVPKQHSIEDLRSQKPGIQPSYEGGDTEPDTVIDKLWKHDAARFEYYWQRACPKYKGAFFTFITQPHTKPVTAKYIKLFFQPDSTASIQTSQPRRVLAIAASDRLLHRFTDVVDELWNIHPLALAPERQLAEFLPLLATWFLIIKDSQDFVTGAQHELDQLTYKWRKTPSRQKIQYLYHIDDKLIRQNETLHSIEEHVRAMDEYHTTRFDGNIEELATDIMSFKVHIKRLIENVESLRDRLKKEQEMIKNDLDLSTNAKVALLTILATLYVPLSYVTAVLSMQLRPDSFSLFTHRNQTGTAKLPNKRELLDPIIMGRDDTNITITSPDLHEIISNQTTYITNAVNGSGGKLYNGTTWAVVSAVIFTVTLLLPLVGPDILRFLYRGVNRMRSVWRVWALAGLSIYFIMIYWGIPLILNHFWFTDLSFDLHGGLYLWDFNAPSSGNLINLVSLVVGAVVMTILWLGCWVRAIVDRDSTHRQWRIVRWTLFLFILILAYLLDAFVYYDDPIESTYDWNGSYEYFGNVTAVETGLAFSTWMPWTYLAVTEVYTILRRRSRA